MESKVYRPIIVFAPSVLAGAEKVVITGTEALADLGLDPHLIVIKEMRAPKLAEDFIKEFSPNIKITIVESEKAIDFKLIKKIKAILKSEEKEIILHTHGFKALVTCKLIFMSLHHIHTHHGNTSHTFKVRVYEWLADQAMKRCDQVIAVSNEMEKLLLRTLSPYKKISVVKNMLSFKNASALREYRKSKKASSAIHLIFIGRLSPEKGLLPFLENFESFSEKSKFILTVLGDGPEMTKARQFVQEKNLHSQISFHGFVSNPSDYLREADLLVLPSLTEGLPMTLIEALASGVPVLANDVGAIKSLLIPNKNGLLLENNQTAHWHKAFTEAILHVKEWQEYTLNQASHIEYDYSAKNWALSTKKIYQSLF